jgi:hypothetical protein
MKQSPEQIKDAATTSIDLISQIGPLAWALQSHSCGIVMTAQDVDSNPERTIVIKTDETLERKEERRLKVLGNLAALRNSRSCRRSELFESAGYRDLINRSIVVYAVTQLELFIEKAAKGFPRLEEKTIADTLCKIQNIRDLGEILQHIGSYNDIGWFILVRNAIIHNNGKANKDIREAAKKYKLCPRWSLRNDALVWDDNAPEQLSGASWNEKTFSISINDFVLPRLAAIQGFMKESAEKLAAAAQNP